MNPFIHLINIPVAGQPIGPIANEEQSDKDGYQDFSADSHQLGTIGHLH